METKKNLKIDLINQLNNLEDNADLSEIQKVTSKFFGNSIWISKLGRKAFVWSIVLAIITLILITTLESRILDIVLYGAWSILPPAWFMYEYTWEFPEDAKYDDKQISDLKYKHELAGKIWAGLVLLMTAIVYFKYKDKIF